MSECHSIYLFSHPSVFSSSLAFTIYLPNVYCSWEKGQLWVTVDSPGIFMLQSKKNLPCHFPLRIAIDIISKGAFRTSAVIDSHFFTTNLDIFPLNYLILIVQSN